MTNQINSFNSTLTDLEAAITRMIAQQNKEDKASEKSNKGKQEYYMSEQNRNDMLAVGNEINRLFAIANDGQSKEDYIKAKKDNPLLPNPKRITPTIIKNHGLTSALDRKDLKQRYSECSMYALFPKTFNATAAVIIEEGEYCTANQKVISRLKKDEVYPYPLVEPEEKNAAWLVDQVFKMMDKNEIALDQFLSTFGKDERVSRHVRATQIVKEMKPTKVSPEKFKNEKDISLAA
tara:strand:+ start:101 stop:805 length:705 start_codon:yes stop_codon:yes gene_type:complete